MQTEKLLISKGDAFILLYCTEYYLSYIYILNVNVNICFAKSIIANCIFNILNIFIYTIINIFLILIASVRVLNFGQHAATVPIKQPKPRKHILKNSTYVGRLFALKSEFCFTVDKQVTRF